MALGAGQLHHWLPAGLQARVPVVRRNSRRQGAGNAANAARRANTATTCRPFAKILLALAYEREQQTDRARPLLAELAEEFPTNPLFAHELALVDNLQCCKR